MIAPRLTPLHRTLAFDHQYSTGTDRVGNVFGSYLCVEDISYNESMDCLHSVSANMHVKHAIKNCEYFLAIVDMPDVRLICPVESYGGTIDCRDVIRRPGYVTYELGRPDNSHRRIVGVSEKRRGTVLVVWWAAWGSNPAPED